MKKSTILFLAFCTLVLAGCLKHPSDNPDIRDRISNFDFVTTKQYTLSVAYATPSAISFSVYDEYPYEEYTDGGVTRRKFIGVEGTYSVENGEFVVPAGSDSKTIEPIFRAITGSNGSWSGQVTLPVHIEGGTGTVWLFTKFANDYMGVPEIVEVTINGLVINFPDGAVGRSASSRASRANNSVPSGVLVVDNGDWDDQGKPNYLLPTRAAVSPTLFHNLMTLLPNNKKTTMAEHPELFGKQTNIESDTEGGFEVDLVFVHDGGDFKSPVGYYWYDKTVYPNGPTNATQLGACQKVVAFPNASYAYDGGNLSTGDQMHLKYTPDNGATWTTKFPSNLSVGFFMYPNGFVNKNVTRDGYLGTIYSNYGADLTKYNQLQQTMLLDPGTGYNKEGEWDVLVLTFEDLPRTISTSWADNDFNDVIFLVKVKKDPKGDIPDIPPTPDPDPTPDPYDNYTVYKGTLAFEDLWPNQGDYDMNDVVIEYYSVVFRDKNNNVVGMVDSLTPRWSGAEFHNAFGYQIDLDYATYGMNNNRVHVSVQTNYNNTGSQTQDDGKRFNTFPGSPRFEVDAYGLERGQDKLVFIVFDDIKPMVPDYNQYRTSGQKPKPTPQYYFRITTRFGDGDPTHDLDLHPQASRVIPPYNPFIVVTESKDVGGNFLPYYRSKEIHLPCKSVPNQYAPTKVATDNNIAYWFRKGDDYSFPAYGYYYLSTINYPWAINIPVYNWNFPRESKRVDDHSYGYPYFGNWVESGGAQDPDWYNYPGSNIGALGQ